MASRDLKGLTIEIGGDTSNLTTALKNVDKELSSLQANLRTVNSALKLDPGNVDALAQKQALLTDAVEETAKRLEVLKEAQRQADEQIANGVEVDQGAYRSLQTEIVRAEASLNDYQRQLTDTSSQLENLADDTCDASDQMDDMADSTDEAGGSAGNAAEGWTVVKDVISDLASKAIQAAIEAFKDLVFEAETALDLLQAKTGASAKTMQKYGDVARDVFKNGWGESLSDVTEAIGTVTNMLGELDEASLRNITENAMTLEDVFGWDVQESVRAAKSLMDQFGISSDEAFNLMVQGAQKGLDQNGDLLDTINEYSVQFSTAGYSADEMFNMLANGAEEGTWSVDKLGDAVKEFNIRMSDQTVVDYITQNYEALGMAEGEAFLFAQSLYDVGGTGEEAMRRVLDAILAIENPTERYKAGVAAFGTMWEDLGEEAVTALFETEGAISSTNDAMSQVKTDAYDNLATSVTTLGRTLKDEIATPIVESISPIVKDIVDWAIKNMDVLAPIIVGVGTAIGIVTVAITGAQVATAIWNAVLMMNPIILAGAAIVAAVAALAGGIIALMRAMDTSGKKIKENAENVTAFSDAIEAAEPNVGDMTKVLSEYGHTLSDLDSMIAETENAITTILATALNEQRQLRDDEIASIKEHNEQLKALQEEKLNMYREAMTVEVMKITAESQTLSQEQAAQYIANMQASLDEANAVSEERYNAQLAQIYNFHKAQGTLNSEAYQNDVRMAQEAYNQELADNQAFFNEGLSQLQTHANQWVLTDAEKWNNVITNTNTSRGKYKAALAEIDLDNANAFMSMYATTVQKGGEISEETAQIAASMIAAFDDLPSSMEGAGKDALLGIVAGMEDQIPALANASEMTAQEIVDVLKEELQINSPSRVTQGIGANVSEGLQSGMDGKKSLVSSAASGIAETIISGLKSKDSEMSGVGANMIEGVEAGMQSKKSWIGGRISSLATSLVSSFKKAFDINSPSRVMRDQIGKMLPEGIGEGIEENAESALEPMDALKNDLTAFDGLSVEKSINVNGSAQSGVQRLTAEINSLRALIEDYLPGIAANSKKDIYLDKRRLVGELAPDMDDALGDIANRRAVGAV